MNTISTESSSRAAVEPVQPTVAQAKLKSAAKHVAAPVSASLPEKTRNSTSVSAQSNQSEGVQLNISGKQGISAEKALHQLVQANQIQERNTDSIRDQLRYSEERDENEEGLSEEEKEQIKELRKRDAEVKAHENAHLAAAGSAAQGGAQYDFQIGPDGQAYAIGGSVHIDTTPGRTPEESIQKARLIRAAALAPSDPSAQDIKVAAEAAKMEAEASAKIAERQREASGMNFDAKELFEEAEKNNAPKYQATLNLIGSTYTSNNEEKEDDKSEENQLAAFA